MDNLAYLLQERSYQLKREITASGTRCDKVTVGVKVSADKGEQWTTFAYGPGGVIQLIGLGAGRTFDEAERNLKRDVDYRAGK